MNTSKPSSQASSEQVGTQDQRYQIIRKLDAGGMAEIYLAKSLSIQGMEKRVAIKRVLPSLAKNKQFIAMFLDEARLSISLNHTNIVQVFDVGRSGDTYFIVMEYVEGYNVRHIFQRAGETGYRVPPELAAYMMLEVSKGLEYAHVKKDPEGNALHIVHRDLSPPNILVSRSGEIKITDFGLAKASSQLSKTDPGVVKGKYAYLCPEVTEGKTPDHRADIFAAGIVLWELLANRRLFYGKTDVETVDLVRACKVPSLKKLVPSLPQNLIDIVNKALAKDPRKRYHSARDMAEDLAQYLASTQKSTTAFDLENMLGELFSPSDELLGKQADLVEKRRDFLGELLNEEIANLSMLGYSKEVRLQGSQPLDIQSLSLTSVQKPHFDLSAVWKGSGPPKAFEDDEDKPTPTLKAMENVEDLSGLVDMLEGSLTGEAPWVAPLPTLGGGSVPEKKSGNGLLLGLLFLLIAAGAAIAFVVL